MICHRMGREPTGTMGLGRNSVSSRSLVPLPPQRITTFMGRGDVPKAVSEVNEKLRGRARRAGFNPTFRNTPGTQEVVTTLTTIIPVFNGEKHLAATLQSVAAQTRRPDRLIVLDNCSTDGTRRVVE